ncbi:MULTISPECIES: PAS domain S-box protein [Deinococcus]|uniref:PAS domain S-box protein n=1 Tax=Deinococcus rufus TaxID=2136097 RepID=A0ABV7Z434_9DEIO|nr:PAS domain S-box protein [Deinococcus sp. AB2017081]WQE95113.1 PAS domain S-box protein [Deinococcus sp. AB2017081]
MRPGQFELRWAYVLFGLLILDSFLVALLVPRPAAYWVLLPLLGVQGLAFWLAQRVIRVVRGYRLLQESYAQELDFARQVMESVEHGLTVLDSSGRFVYVNRAYAALLGRPAAEIVGRSPFDFTVAEDHTHLTQARDARREGRSNTYRTRLRRADGSEVEVQITGTPRLHQGRMVGNFAAIVPVSQLSPN